MWSFLKHNPIASVVLVFGAFITVAVKLNDLYTLYNLGLPRLAWEAVGSALFFGAVVALLYRWRVEQQTLPTKTNEFAFLSQSSSVEYLKDVYTELLTV